MFDFSFIHLGFFLIIYVLRLLLLQREKDIMRLCQNC